MASHEAAETTFEDGPAVDPKNIARRSDGR
jgi:hypothetical protein